MAFRMYVELNKHIY